MGQPEHPAVTAFRKYLRIKTVHPTPDYAGATEFLKAEARDAGLKCQVLELVKGKPIVIMTWTGTQPELPSVFLNSHIDVVPVEAESWSHDPFAADKTEDGRIWARGTQDMKCVGISYLYTIRKLREAGKTFPRTIHISWVPDEEIGGADGMAKLIETEEFKVLNVGVALDEGMANETDKFTVFVGEKGPWWLKIVAHGQPGHGSRFIPNPAPTRLVKVLNKVLQYRDEQEAILNSDPDLRIGDVVSVNLTMLSGGQQVNVVPSEAIGHVDIRLPPTISITDFEAMVQGWMEEGVTYEWVFSTPINKMTAADDSNPWWAAFTQACAQAGIELERPAVFPAGTDSRYIRRLGIPAFGFTPVNNTPILLHEHDEYLGEDVFLRGLDIYAHIIPALAGLQY